jgi:hypothetical protein
MEEFTDEVVDICAVLQIDVRHIDRLTRITTFSSAQHTYYPCSYEKCPNGTL